MKVGFSGSRDGLTDAQRRSLEKLLLEIDEDGVIEEVAHGDCVGADEDFHCLAKKLLPNASVVIHPPANSALRAFCIGTEIREEKSYNIRNAEIVRESDIVIACPQTAISKPHSGTWNVVNMTRKYGRNLFIIHNDGSIVKEECSR